jgi:hypothetical protein
MYKTMERKDSNKDPSKLTPSTLLDIFVMRTTNVVHGSVATFDRVRLELRIHDTELATSDPVRLIENIIANVGKQEVAINVLHVLGSPDKTGCMTNCSFVLLLDIFNKLKLCRVQLRKIVFLTFGTHGRVVQY